MTRFNASPLPAPDSAIALADKPDKRQWSSPHSHPGDEQVGTGYRLTVELRWDDPLLAVKSDERRTFNYRLLQSWY